MWKKKYAKSASSSSGGKTAGLKRSQSSSNVGGASGGGGARGLGDWFEILPANQQASAVAGTGPKIGESEQALDSRSFYFNTLSRMSSWVSIVPVVFAFLITNTLQVCPAGVQPKDGTLLDSRHVIKPHNYCLDPGSILNITEFNVQKPVHFEVGALVWVPDDEDVANPASVARNPFCPGEKGCVVFDDDDGTELELMPEETACLMPMDSQVLKPDISDLITLDSLHEYAIL
jgi:hypothetical protein